MGINALWPPRVKSHRDAASFDLRGESGKKASIHFQCFDPRTFSIPSIYSVLPIKDAPRNPRFSLPLPSLRPLYEIKKDEEESRDAMEEQHEKGKSLDETSRTDGTKGELFGLRWIDFIVVQPPPAELGVVYSREIRLIIRLINWSASICRAYRSRCSQFNWSPSSHGSWFNVRWWCSYTFRDDFWLSNEWAEWIISLINHFKPNNKHT